MMALSKNDGRPDHRLPPLGHRAATASSSARAAPCWSSSPRSTRCARGAHIYAYVLGAGISNDAHDIAQPDPEGRGGTRAIKMALREGDVDPATVVHVNAHATSTPKGDIAEGLMLHAVLGEHVDSCVVTSTKSMTGHLLGGAGALEAVATVLALKNRISPPTINLDNKDPEVDLDIPTSARALPDGDIVALNNSFGFGGANVAVAFGSA